MTVTGWIVLSKGTRAEVLTLGTSERYLIWKPGLWSFNPIFMRSRGWTPIHYDMCCKKKGSFNTETDTHREKTVWREGERVKMKARIGVMRLQATEHQGKLANHQKVGERRGTSFRRDQPCQRVELRRPASELWDNTFPLLKPPSLWSFDVGALENRSGAHYVSGVVLSTLYLWIHFNFHNNFMRKRWLLLMFYQWKN